MGRLEITRGRQALELRSNLSERRSLTDLIQTSDCSAASSARNLQWAVAHGTWRQTTLSNLTTEKLDSNVEMCFFTVLPNSHFIHFECGVKVQLGFVWKQMISIVFSIYYWCFFIIFSVDLPLNSPTSWSSTPAYWTSPKKLLHALLNSLTSQRYGHTHNEAV